MISRIFWWGASQTSRRQTAKMPRKLFTINTTTQQVSPVESWYRSSPTLVNGIKAAWMPDLKRPLVERNKRRVKKRRQKSNSQLLFPSSISAWHLFIIYLFMFIIYTLSTTKAFSSFPFSCAFFFAPFFLQHGSIQCCNRRVCFKLPLVYTTVCECGG